jgi:hypothetical protein
MSDGEPERSLPESMPSAARFSAELRLRKALKTKETSPSEAARKLLYLPHTGITQKWSAPMRDWAKILNQLASLFQGRFHAWPQQFTHKIWHLSAAHAIVCGASQIRLATRIWRQTARTIYS